MNVDVIYTFNFGHDACNGIRSIKTDIYFTLGWVWFAATSIKRYGDHISAGPTLTTFQNKRHVRFRIPFLFWTVSSLMHALLQKGQGDSLQIQGY